MQYGLFRAVDRGVVLDKCKLLNSCKHFYAHRTTASINNYNDNTKNTSSYANVRSIDIASRRAN